MAEKKAALMAASMAEMKAVDSVELLADPMAARMVA